MSFRLASECIMTCTGFLMEDPCPLGVLEILTENQSSAVTF